MSPTSAAAAGRAHAAPLKRKIAAILAADVAGYSRLVAEDEERTLRDLAGAREIFDALVVRGGGRIFNTAGDSVMCEFDSAVEAVRVAIDIQESLRAHHLGQDPRRRLEFRMGLTIGDVVERDGDLLGDGVNIAARLEALAPPGGICVSRSVHEAVANKLSVGFTELGARQVKNIPQPIHAYLIAPPAAALQAAEPLTAHGRSRPASNPSRRGRGGYVGAAVAAVLLCVGLLVGLLAGPPLYETIRSKGLALGGSEPRVATGPATPPLNEERQPATGQAADTPSAPRPARAAPPADKPPRQAQRDVPKVEPPKPPTTKPEPAKPEPARPEAVKPEAAKPARALPADPAAAYAALASDGVLPDARTLPELYHNARAHEAKGERAAALTAYAALAPLAGEYLDPHLRHASLLRAVKGPNAARQTYASLARTNPSRATAIVSALSTENDDRTAKLEAFAAANPGAAGAADYLMAEALMERRDGGPTLTERRLAFDALDRFLEAASAGELAGQFIDRAVLDGWLDGARKRRSEIEASFTSAATRPTAAFSRTATGWLARFTLPEPATTASVRVGERGEFEPLGASRQAEARPGKSPSLEKELPASSGRTTLYVAYRDRAGREAGPFPLTFDPPAAEADAGRATLERFPDSWVAFRPDIPDLLSFAGLVSNRCAIARATIGFGDAPPREKLPIPPCDTTGPAAMPSGASLLTLPDGTDTVQIQLTYADGTESQVRSFHRP
ncbi:adenylate/guanylate cyclase domain-containing protein [uncultured Enterovirga sp.]|uniref:adenylate/guanylate cyclase domain-containing protein n=1 Tax=uncultured Enterovirga sp. TaxID=2026352 RepID=UPI0035CA1ED0